MVILLLIISALLAALLGAVLAVSIQIFRAYASTVRQFQDFVASPGKDDKGNDLPSPLAETVDLAAQCIATRAGQTIHAMINGQASGMSRGLKAVEADLANSQIAMTNNPLAQLAGSLLGKQIKKNPVLGMAIAQFAQGGIGGFMGGTREPVPAGNNHKSQTEFKLGI